MVSSNVKIAAFPAKRFFVEMLTRDIELSDSILDLLDNCLDGVLRKTISLQSKPSVNQTFTRVTMLILNLMRIVSE